MAPAGSDPATGAPGRSPHPAGQCHGGTGVGLEKLRGCVPPLVGVIAVLLQI